MRDTIERIVTAVQRIPTPENGQPWTFRIYDSGLEIVHDSKRDRIGSFPDDIGVLNFGMVVEAIAIEASAFSLTSEFTYFLEDRSDDRPWLRVKFSADDVAPDPLVGALELRYADRRCFAGGSLADPVFDALRSTAANAHGAKLYLTGPPPKSFIEQLRIADDISMEIEDVRRDLNYWLRFTDKSIAETQDGMSWRALLRGPEKWYSWWQSRLWWLEASLDWYPDWLLQLEERFFDDSGKLTPYDMTDVAAVGCITTTSANVADLVNAGRLALRVWLTLNQRGYGFQPLTNLTCAVYPQRLGTWYLPQEYRNRMKSAYDVLQKTFGFAGSETPIFCFRTGLPIAPFPAKARTLRRPDRIQHVNGPLPVQNGRQPGPTSAAI